MRIAIGGFQHETNTFAPNPATLADFEAADGWPGLVRGAEMLDAVRGINLPIAGFISEALQDGHTLVPLTWCSAAPSAHVTKAAYEQIAAALLDDLRSVRHLDGIYLDLHGAMVAEHIDDADGELLRRVRKLVGNDLPVVASLDFHANTDRPPARWWPIGRIHTWTWSTPVARPCAVWSSYAASSGWMNCSRCRS